MINLLLFLFILDEPKLDELTKTRLELLKSKQVIAQLHAQLGNCNNQLSNMQAEQLKQSSENDIKKLIEELNDNNKGYLFDINTMQFVKKDKK